jgi:serine/threonine-protein kinase RsbW
MTDVPATERHSLTIPAAVPHIEEACDFVTDMARSVGLSDDAVYHCCLSVEEICTNVIEHGYRAHQHDQVIDVQCILYVDHLRIVISDDAVPFNPLDNDDPDPSAPLCARHEGGWGVFFVKKYMDKVDYRYERNRNHFFMEKYVRE